MLDLDLVRGGAPLSSVERFEFAYVDEVGTSEFRQPTPTNYGNASKPNDCTSATAPSSRLEDGSKFSP
ncbi:hypothetical protein [Actinokineospora sp. HUAS TT18]|uniref:hypothetical protein n=1 Tax=Actinokineospora sp. HUAS TT18 TaxID=3447451 RepID=UPI003F524C3C